MLEMRRVSMAWPLLAVLLCAGPAFAHDTWLLPATFHVEPGGTIVLDMTSGMAFPKPESPVKADRIAASGIRLGGQTAVLEPQAPTASALRLSGKAAAAGIATLWAVSKPRTLTLKADEVKHYLEEVGAPASVAERWRKQQRWRESYTKLAKTYVAVGSVADDMSWQEPVGLALEMIPLQGPADLRPGTQFAVRVLRGGKPLPGLSLSAAGPGPGNPLTAHTDSDGRAVFRLDRAGPWLLRGTLIEESSGSDRDWDSLFATLVVSVRPK